MLTVYDKKETIKTQFILKIQLGQQDFFVSFLFFKLTIALWTIVTQKVFLCR